MIWKLALGAAIAGLGLYSLFIIATCVSVLLAVPLEAVVVTTLVLYGVAAFILIRSVESLKRPRSLRYEAWSRTGRRVRRRWWV